MELSSLPRGTILKKDLEIQGLFFRLQESGLAVIQLITQSIVARELAPA